MSTATGIDIAAAHQRLLPEAIPLRFFGTAVVSQAMAWIAIVIVADAIPFYQGGPGPVAAAFHLLTVGVLLATAMGASLQMLPVALGRTAPGAGLCHTIFALLILGGIGLVGGFATYHAGIIVAGAVALVLSVALYVSAIVGILHGASSLRLVRTHVWAALACLGLGVLLALLLAIDYSASFLPAHRTLAVIHMSFVAYGFLGLLALGLSQILIPMFAIAEPAESRLPGATLVLVLAALATAVTALLAGQAPFVAVAACLGVAAVGCHVAHTESMLARRMRRRLGGEFQLIRVSWLMLAAALLVAGGLALGLLAETAPALIGFFTLFGWLLSLVVGVQQRILPFLGSMHVLRAGARPVAPNKLLNERCLQIHRWCHFSALVLVAAAILVAQPAIIRLGGSAGFVGALAYGLFGITVLQNPQPSGGRGRARGKDTAMSEQALLSDLLHREHLHTLAVAGDLEARADDKRAGPIDIADAEDRGRLEALIHVADIDIHKHYRFEEDVLFPRLVAAGLGPMVDVLVMEHDAVRAIAGPLRADAEAALRDGFTQASWRTFREAVFDLVNSVSFHIQKEELGVIRQIDALLGADANRELGALYAGYA